MFDLLARCDAGERHWLAWASAAYDAEIEAYGALWPPADVVTTLPWAPPKD